MATRFKKSQNERIIAGVCGGIAEYFDWDPTIVRIVFVVAAVAGVGSPILLYLLMALVMPS